jgi:hypothetical protein
MDAGHYPADAVETLRHSTGPLYLQRRPTPLLVFEMLSNFHPHGEHIRYQMICRAPPLGSGSGFEMRARQDELVTVTAFLDGAPVAVIRRHFIAPSRQVVT